MSENYAEYDETDPTVAKRLETLRKLNEYTSSRCTSWADLYAALKDQAHVNFSAPSKKNADLTVVLLLSFVLALEELPEEGDVGVISRKMNEIMVMHPEKTGMMLYLGEEADAMRKEEEAQSKSLLSLVSNILESVRDSVEEPEEGGANTAPHVPGITKARVLH